MNTLIAKITLALTAFFILTDSALAVAPDARKQALAEQVLVASGNDARIAAIRRATSDREKLTSALRAALPKNINSAAIDGAVSAETKFEADEFYKENIRIYATYFTDAQLGDMLTFYHSPGGKALVAQTPAIFAEKANFGRWLGGDTIRRMVASVCNSGLNCRNQH